jgi:regulator of sigma E protease
MIDETQTAEKLSAPAKPWEFRSKKAYQRLLIMAGGVMVNFFLALIIYSAVFYTWGDKYYAVKDMTMGMKFNDEAKALGFQDHDILLRSDLGEFKDFSGNLMRDISKAHEVIVLRNNREVLVPLNGDLNLLNMLKAEPVFCRPFIPALVDSVYASSPAFKAGIRKGDTIVKLGNKDIDTWGTFEYEVSRMTDALTDAKTTNDSLGVLTNIVVWKKADGTRDTAQVTFTYQDERVVMGVGQSLVKNFYKPHHDEFGFLESVKKGCTYGIDVLGGYISDLKYVASKEGAKSLGGFGAIGSMFPEYWDWMVFWKMTAFLSIILAFMNIIPIPGLDGGHILFLLVEVITRKQPSLKFMQIAQNIGMGFLLILMVVANLNDILRWLGVM